MNNTKKEIYSFLPKRLINVLDIALCDEHWKALEEIRIFKKGHVIVSINNTSYCISECLKLSTTSKNAYLFDHGLIGEIINLLTGFSPYAYEIYMSKGYISARGGHRVGICGTFFQNGERKFPNAEIMALNIRVAKPVYDFDNSILNKISVNNRILNTVVISPPKCGKTTFLRNFAKHLSYIKCFPSICIVDERKELCSIEKGIPYYDVGDNTFVIDSAKKDIAIKMAIESLSPNVIVCDELSDDNDAKAVYNAILSGISVVFSCHGNCYDDFAKKYSQYLTQRIEFYVLLGNSQGTGTIECAKRCDT